MARQHLRLNQKPLTLPKAHRTSSSYYKAGHRGPPLPLLPPFPFRTDVPPGYYSPPVSASRWSPNSLARGSGCSPYWPRSHTRNFIILYKGKVWRGGLP